jgi:hypothetical protein
VFELASLAVAGIDIPGAGKSSWVKLEELMTLRFIAVVSGRAGELRRTRRGTQERGMTGRGDSNRARDPTKMREARMLVWKGMFCNALACSWKLERVCRVGHKAGGSTTENRGQGIVREIARDRV